LGKIRQPLLSLGATGSLADTLTYQRLPGVSIVRSKPPGPGTRTLAQVYQRWLYNDYLELWSRLAAADKLYWRKEGSKQGLPQLSAYLKDRLTNQADLAALWHLDEATGAIAYDSSRNTNHGNIIGASPDTGKINGALFFDGLNDYINCGNDPSLKIADPLSIVLTCYLLPTIGVEQRVLVSKYKPGSIPLLIWFTGADLLYFGITTDITGWSFDFIQPYPPNAWYRIAMTYTSGAFKLYVDGDLKKTLGTTGPVAQPFRGIIDEVEIYNRILPDEDILRHALRHYP